MVATQQSHTLIADDARQYTFTPLPGWEGEVMVSYVGPRHSTQIVVSTVEARELYQRLLKRGFVKW